MGILKLTDRGEESARYALAHVLWALPDDADDIATMLASKGITGKECEASECPLAHHLSRELGGCSVIVSPDGISLPGMYCYVTLPAKSSVLEFIFRFDSGHYPELHEKI